MTEGDIDWGGQKQELVSYGGVHRTQAYLLRPRSDDELAAIFQRAAAEGRRVTLRGAGLSFDDQSLGDDLVVSLERFGGIQVDPAAGTVTVGAAAPWGEISLAALRHDLWPAVVVSGRETTAAGTLSANSYSRFTSGLGKESHWIERLRVVLPTGERLTCSRSENADLFRAVIGGQGCIAAVVEATYRLIPLKGARQVRTELRKTTSYSELIHELIRAPPQGVEGVSTVLVPGTTKAFIFRSRYVVDQVPDPLPGMASDTWWRVPLEWAGRPAAVSQAFWRFTYRTLYREHRGYVDDLFGYTFFMDPNTRAKRLARRFGFRMPLTQQTHLIPAEEPSRAIDFLGRIQEAMARFRVSPVFYDIVVATDDPDSLLSSSAGRPGFLISAAFEPLSEASLHRTEACCRALAHDCALLGGRVHLSKNVHADTLDLEAMYGPQLDRYFAVKRRADPQGILTSRFFERLFPDRMRKSRADSQ